MTDIIIEKDGDGYLARISGVDNLFAYGDTKEQAQLELLGVLVAMLDIQKNDKQLLKVSINQDSKYAVQV